MKRIVTFAVLTIAVLGSETAVSANAMSNTVHQQSTAGAYRLTLQIGPAEAMSNHPSGTTGERMLAGKMASCSTAGGGMGGMQMGKTCNRHIEVHINNRQTGKVVTNAHVTIGLTKARAHTTITVPIMTMVGAKAPMSDLHYGNNIYAASGSYTVKVRVNSASASFAVTLK